jgi:predicted oxidoreductase
MKTYRIPHTDLVVSRLGYGCMGLGGAWDRTPYSPADQAKAASLIAAALEQGINFFDHADIYTYGKAEAVFGAVLGGSPGLRQKLVLQSKCGIRFADDPVAGMPGRYDFSYAHITASVEGSLSRLQTDYLDLLLLHRPDPLVEPEEVARAFDELQQAGKVRYFGVSNHNPDQIELLRRYVRQPLVVNQVELNLLHAGLIRDGFLVNQDANRYSGAGGILDYCRRNEILVQAWAPVANGRLINPPPEADTNILCAAAEIAKLAEQKHTSREAIALAWLLRHPAGIQPIVGTTNLGRLQASCAADTVELSREEWYRLLVSAQGFEMP